MNFGAFVCVHAVMSPFTCKASTACRDVKGLVAAAAAACTLGGNVITRFRLGWTKEVTYSHC